MVINLQMVCWQDIAHEFGESESMGRLQQSLCRYMEEGCLEYACEGLLRRTGHRDTWTGSSSE